MKFFYVGMQRCGTKSFGDFFKREGFRVFSWPEITRYNLSNDWFDGHWLKILQSEVIKGYDVFEDGPFQDPQFAKFLSQHIDGSKFIYFQRPADDWYKSMVTHSRGLTLGDLTRHCYAFDRLEELNFMRQNGLGNLKKLNMLGMKSHYVRIYKRHQDQIFEKFSHQPSDNFFFCDLYDPEKFRKMCEHFSLRFNKVQEQHSHKSQQNFSDVVREHKYMF